MAAQDEFSRFFFEVWLDDSDGQDEYLITPERYVRFERRCQRYVAYTYDGSVFYADEYEVGLCRPSAMANYSSVIVRDELSLDEARGMLSMWQGTHRPIPEEDVPFCEEEGRYYCGSGTLPADPMSTAPGRRDALDEPDVAANARLACWLADVWEAELLEHMEGIGLPRFDESLEAGLDASPFAAIREAARYVGCPLEFLLGTDDDLFRWLIGRVCDSGEWELYPGSPDPGGRQSAPSRSLLGVDESCRAFLLGADYADRGFSICTELSFSTAVTVVDGVSVSDISIRRELSDPSPDVARAFLDAYATAGGDVCGGGSLDEDTVKSAEAPDAIRVNEFLVRRSFGSHSTGGHRLDLVRASVSVLPRDGGGPVPVEFDAWWYPKCGKHYMSEDAYLSLKRRGYICCRVVEEKDLGTRREGVGLYDNLASESVLHMYGYTVNQRDDLTADERRTIISFVIENRVQTAQEVARLLEWLISQREGVPGMSVAVGRWRADLDFVMHYHGPTRTVRVDSIYARV